MKNKNFYIKRIKFIKNNNEYENLDNLWVICLESGDQMVKVSSYFNPVTLKDLESTLWHIKILNERKSTCNFYTKNVEYIQVPNEKIMIINNQEPIIYEETNSNNKIDIGNFEEILDFHKSVHPDNDDSEEITYDYGLFINVNENEESTPVKNVNNEFKFIYNSFVEYDKVLMPRNPKNINGKDKFHEVKPYRCLDTKKWEIKSLVSNNDEDDEHSNLSSLFG